MQFSTYITIGYQVLINVDVVTLRLAQAMCPLLTMLAVGNFLFRTEKPVCVFVEDVIQKMSNWQSTKPDGSQVAKLCLGSTLCRH